MQGSPDDYRGASRSLQWAIENANAIMGNDGEEVGNNNKNPAYSQDDTDPNPTHEDLVANELAKRYEQSKLASDKKIRGLTNQVRQLTHERVAALDDVAQLRLELDTLSRTNDDINSRKQNIEHHSDDSAKEASGELSRLRSENTTLSETVEELQRALRCTDDDMVAKLKLQVHELSADAVARETNLADLQQMNIKLHEAIQEEEAKASISNAQLSAAQHELDELRTLYAELQEQAKSKDELVERGRAECALVSQELSKLQQQQREREDQFQLEAERFRAEIDGLQQSQQEDRAALAKSYERLRELEEELSVTTTALHAEREEKRNTQKMMLRAVMHDCCFKTERVATCLFFRKWLAFLHDKRAERRVAEAQLSCDSLLRENSAHGDTITKQQAEMDEMEETICRVEQDLVNAKEECTKREDEKNNVQALLREKKNVEEENATLQESVERLNTVVKKEQARRDDDAASSRNHETELLHDITGLRQQILELQRASFEKDKQLQEQELQLASQKQEEVGRSRTEQDIRTLVIEEKPAHSNAAAREPEEVMVRKVSFGECTSVARTTQETQTDSLHSVQNERANTDPSKEVVVESEVYQKLVREREALERNVSESRVGGDALREQVEELEIRFAQQVQQTTLLQRALAVSESKGDEHERRKRAFLSEIVAEIPALEEAHRKEVRHLKTLLSNSRAQLERNEAGTVEAVRQRLRCVVASMHRDCQRSVAARYFVAWQRTALQNAVQRHVQDAVADNSRKLLAARKHVHELENKKERLEQIAGEALAMNRELQTECERLKELQQQQGDVDEQAVLLNVRGAAAEGSIQVDAVRAKAKQTSQIMEVARNQITTLSNELKASRAREAQLLRQTDELVETIEHLKSQLQHFAGGTGFGLDDETLRFLVTTRSGFVRELHATALQKEPKSYLSAVLMRYLTDVEKHHLGMIRVTK